MTKARMFYPLAFICAALAAVVAHADPPPVTMTRAADGSWLVSNNLYVAAVDTNGNLVSLKVGGGDRAREREVEGESCQEVAVAAATIIALTVDPNVDTAPPRAAPSASQPRARPKREPAARPEAEPAVSQPERTDQAPAHFGLVVGGHGAVDARTLPNPALGLGLDLGLVVRLLRLDVSLSHFPEQRATRTQVQILGELLCECAATLHDPAGPQIDEHSGCDSLQVESFVIEEPLVLDR